MSRIDKLREEVAERQRLKDALEQQRLQEEANNASGEAFLETMADLKDAAEELARANLRLGEANGVTGDALLDLRKKLKDASAEAKAYGDALSKAREEQERIAGAAEELGKELAGLIPVIGGNVDFMDTFGGKLAAATKNADGLGAGISDVVGKFKEQFTVTQVATNIMAANEEMMAAYILSSIALGVAIDEQAASFARATGMGEKYDDAIMKTVRANQDAGVSVEDAFEAYESLITTTSKFTDMSASQQSAIAGTVSVLNELGVSSDVSAQNLQIMTTSLNMNASEAEETSRRLLTAAQAMGVAPQQMAADFSAAGASFASFGENAVDAFIDLREAAKKTGIELQSLLSITEQFTTFEGAANNVGKLNALLGGPFLNTIDMVTLSLEDPAAALQEVRNAVLDAGLSFEDMNPAMRRAVAAAAGLEDAGQLAALMSGEMDGLGGASAATAKQLEELKEATEFTQSFSDELEATRLAFTANFRPLIELAVDALNIMQEIAEFLGPGGTMLAAITAFSATAVLTFVLVRRGIAATAAPVLALNTQLTALNANLAALAASSTTITATSAPASTALAGFGAAAAAAVKPMLALGAAVALIGVGVFAAASGLSMLVESFSKLSGDQLSAATKGLLGFAVSLGVLVGVMMFFAQPLGLAAIGGLLAVGSAVALIGVGIGAAAAGMSLLISSIGDLASTADDLLVIGEVFENLSVPKMVTYTTAMTATAAVGMTPAAIAIAARGGGGAAGGGTTKVDVRIEGEVSKFLEAKVQEYGDARYIKKGAVTPGAKTPRGRL